LNGLVHKKKQKKIKKIQIMEKKKYKVLLKKKEAEFKEDIQEKLRQTGLFIPGISPESQKDAQRKMVNKRSNNGHLAFQSNDKKNQMISEIIKNKPKENNESGFYVNYSSDSNSEYISEGTLNDDEIDRKLEEMKDEQRIKDKVRLEEDLDEISLDMVDPHTFTLGRNDNALQNLNTDLSYVNDRITYKSESEKMMEKNLEARTQKKVSSKRRKLERLSDDKDSLEMLTKKKNWSEADSFSADSEEGKIIIVRKGT
jgi:hypothetical protein